MKKGGLRFAHIPYSFKVLSILESYRFGYKNILWIDISLHPINNLDKVFEDIEKKGTYFFRKRFMLRL